jgi:formylglycine-generating enzyme required for sulfatase activity
MVGCAVVQVGGKKDDRGARSYRDVSVAAFTLVLSAACSSDPQARPQLVVVLDTDAPVVGQIVDRSGLSPAVAIDTVRVDVISGDRDVADYRDVTAPDPRDWPISFGVASQSGTSRVIRLRVRAFRASLASRGLLNGITTLEPPENALIDRIVDVEQPERGMKTVRIVLATACFGAPASFESPSHTCIDAARRDGRPSDGLLETVPASLVGTALEGKERPCAAAPRPGALCVAGGASILGDPRVNDVTLGIPTAPRRPVLLSPFYMDTTEFTVGRYRRLIAKGAASELPQPRDPSNSLQKYCTWLTPIDATNDDFPLNCISYEAAARACEVEGGQLPTEAQWEHAARGRGRGYLFAWGDDSPQCCSASSSRVSLPDVRVQCGPASGLEPVGSHVEANCPAVDVSIDGIQDLSGSLREVTRDGGLSYAHPCWMGPGLRLDPTCADTERRPGTVGRGGDWSAGTFLLATALRTIIAMPAIHTGFRCVYADSP